MTLGTPYPYIEKPNTLRVFMFGFAAGIGTAVLALVLLAMVWTGPKLAVQVSMPKVVGAKTPFTIEVVVGNPHDEELSFSDLTFPDRVLEKFRIESLSPPASTESPVGGLGIQTYFYELTLPPESEEAIEIVVLPTIPGSHLMEFDVCNAFQDCVTTLRRIQVSPATE